MIGLLGGTFDPVHRGHLQLATEVKAAFKLERVDFIPCHHPVHREPPSASPEQRQHMLQLALAGQSGLGVNTIELERDQPSYAVDTLRELRERYPQQVFCWIMGGDAYNGFARWKNPEEILKLAHLVVCLRPGIKLADSPFETQRVSSVKALSSRQAGGIMVFPMSPNHCSSTAVRSQLKQTDAMPDCLSPSVIKFIRKNQLYEC